MNKAYSNKALPPGTVLREWRLEEVLGVGGFGIVYKARGIYFNELVAIKEYFPSSISERDEEATVVPIDSDAEEVHALGLKKFVEEAKLLWNLSTPSRHPNIVSVRSLFEIHGTAYMVMDFEDGTSLSKLIKDGYRFNERSLWDIIRPISEGLDRAHRVGVLHRDIKPPNILITPEGRSVLIDFGSARFDTAEATSTQVTFHTPPYAAIEQYVKTYKQGPWTDIYALGVVLYECVTGTKPPEVLERLHGGQGQPLRAGKWPGYSKGFLAAIDTAMTIKPEERPQSIGEWLALFPEGGSLTATDEEDERTHFSIHEVAVEEIVPVAPPAEAADVPIETKVPESTDQAKFKRAGHDTNVERKISEPTPLKDETPGKPETPAARNEAPPAAKKEAAAAAPATSNGRKTGLVAAGSAAAVLALVAAGYVLVPKTSNSDALNADAEQAAALAATNAGTYSGPDTGMLAPGLKALADEARAASVPDSALAPLVEAGDKLAGDQQQLQSLLSDPARSGEAAALQTSMNQAAMAADKAFAQALAGDAAMRRQRLVGAAPWTDSATGRPSSAAERSYVQGLDGRASAFQAAAQAVAAAPDGARSSAAARDALGKYSALLSTFAAVPGPKLAASPEAPKPKPVKNSTGTAVTTTAPAATQTATPSAVTSAATKSDGISPAKLSELNGIIDDGRGMARQVIRAGSSENAKLARGYDDYLRTLKGSARVASTNAQADKLIAQAKQTRAYLVFLVKQSR